MRDPLLPALLAGTGAILLASVASSTSGTAHLTDTGDNLVLSAAAAVALIYLLAFGFGARILSRLHPRPESNLWTLAAALTGIGLAEVGRLRPDLVFRQTAWVVAGVMLALLMARVDGWKRLKNYKYALATCGLTLLGLTFLFGIEVGGAKAWLAVGGLGFQPSEFVKIIIILFTASYLSERRELFDAATRTKGLPSLASHRAIFGPLVLMWVIFFGMMVGQKDLGGALLFFSLFIVMLYVATGHARYLTVGGALVVASGWFAYLYYPHVAVRVEAWLNPFADPTGAGYQLLQALFALAAGGLTGTGIGAGSAGHIPAVHTDFIFAAIGEEMGLIGAVAILALSLLVLAEGTRISLLTLEKREYFDHLVAVGVTAAWGIQLFLIVGGIVRLLPLTGVTLPLVSYGGSSTLTSFLMLGAMVRLATGERGAS